MRYTKVCGLFILDCAFRLLTDRAGKLCDHMVNEARVRLNMSMSIGRFLLT